MDTIVSQRLFFVLFILERGDVVDITEQQGVFRLPIIPNNKVFSEISGVDRALPKYSVRTWYGFSSLSLPLLTL